jgi:hypothetical protein
MEKLVDRDDGAGVHRIIFSPNGMMRYKGIYIYVLVADDNVVSEKLIVL